MGMASAWSSVKPTASTTAMGRLFLKATRTAFASSTEKMTASATAMEMLFLAATETACSSLKPTRSMTERQQQTKEVTQKLRRRGEACALQIDSIT